MKYLVREIKYREHLDEAINEGRIQAIPVDKLSDVLGVLAKKDVPMTDLEDYMIGIKDALKLGLDYNELLKVLENAFNPDELNAWVYHNSDKDAYNNLYPDDEYKKAVNESKDKNLSEYNRTTTVLNKLTEDIINKDSKLYKKIYNIVFETEEDFQEAIVFDLEEVYEHIKNTYLGNIVSAYLSLYDIYEKNNTLFHQEDEDLNWQFTLLAYISNKIPHVFERINDSVQDYVDDQYDDDEDFYYHFLIDIAWGIGRSLQYKYIELDSLLQQSNDVIRNTDNTKIIELFKKYGIIKNEDEELNYNGSYQIPEIAEKLHYLEVINVEDEIKDWIEEFKNCDMEYYGYGSLLYVSGMDKITYEKVNDDWDSWMQQWEERLIKQYKDKLTESKEEDKKKLGAFVKLNAGDVEEGNKIFNKNCGNECSEGEAMTEAIDATPDMLDQAYEGSYYTITGAGGAIEDWEKGYQELLTKEEIGQIKEWITFKGKDMNDKYDLSGDVAYPDDLTFLAFPLDGLDVGKLAMFKLKMEDRWFDDIVDNNSSNMNEGLNNRSFEKVLQESIELKETWERRISKELAFKLRDAIDNEDKEALANSFKEVVNYIKIKFPDLVEDDYEFDSLEDDAETLGPEDDDDQFDYVLERLYDYLDEKRIWLPIQALDESFNDTMNESVDLLENFEVSRFSIIAGNEEGQTESVYDGEYIEETIYKYNEIKDNYNICYIYDNEDGEKIEQEEIDSWRSAMEYETGSDLIELDEDLFNEPNDKDEFLRDLAKEDYEDGNVYDINDFYQFKQICSECGQEVDEDDFNTYLEYVDEIREEDIFQNDDRLDYLRRKEEVMPLDKEERYELTFGSEDDEDLEEDLNDQMIDQINDRDANYEADKETTREVRKELAKQGIATDENGAPINETINVREALNDMDKELDQPHLLNLYDAISLSIDEKKELVEMISTKQGVKQISKYLNNKYKLDEDIEDEEDIEDISHLVFDVHVGDGKFIEELDVSSIDEIDHYFKLIKDVHEAEVFNYHSDHWGNAEEYQNQNVSLIENLSPYIGKEVYIEYEDGCIKGTLLGIAIDTQYNNVNHTKIILDSIEDYDF